MYKTTTKNKLQSTNKSSIKSLLDLFVEKKVSSKAISIYFILKEKRYMDTAISKASYPELRLFTGISSDQTICKYLKELKSKGFISFMGNSQYRLWHLKTNIKNTTEIVVNSADNTTVSVVEEEKNTTKTVVPHTCMYINTNPSNEKKRKQQQIKNVVVFNFSENSIFRKIPKEYFDKLLLKYDLYTIQHHITNLEKRYVLKEDYSENCTKRVVEDSLRLLGDALKIGYKYKQEEDDEKAEKERVKSVLERKRGLSRLFEKKEGVNYDN